jgi:predicted AAA+ superfamily ATPase
MWIPRDFQPGLLAGGALPIKVLKGPRQVGKTSCLERLGTHRVVYLDDAAVRSRAVENPRLFLDGLPSRVILDEAALAPELFGELKRRVDEERRGRHAASVARAGREPVDVWITGSNQTLLQRSVRESLAGRASYFDLNTLSIHELGDVWRLNDFLLRGGWPELWVSPQLDPVRYLNDLVLTFIEKDIVAAAGIERHAAFSKCLQLMAARVGQLFNFSDVAAGCGVELTTVQSWARILEANGVIRRLEAFASNLNQRLIKSPKFYFEDVALATRLQGWTEQQPLLLSPVTGSLIENVVVSEVTRCFLNRGQPPRIAYVRSKEKAEVDLLIHLPDNRAIAIEVKTTPQDFTPPQLRLLDSLRLPLIERWIVSPTAAPPFEHGSVVPLDRLWHELDRLL